ncbi:MAG: Imm30 family immunity protein [Pseudomonadota bacterium]
MTDERSRAAPPSPEELRQTLDRRLAALDAVDLDAPGGGLGAFDRALAEIAALGSSAAVEPLTRFFRQDEGPHENAMWSLLHTVEHLAGAGDDPRYVANLLPTLPGLCQTAPRWAAILLIRVLNAPPCTRALRDRLLTGARPAELEAVVALVRSIDRVSPEFQAKTRRLELDRIVPPG